MRAYCRSPFVPLVVLLSLAIILTGAIGRDQRRLTSRLTLSWGRSAPLPVATRGRPAAADVTLLDEVGRLARALPQGQVEAWRAECRAGRAAVSRLAWLHLWLGEYELAYERQPGKAIRHFRQAQRCSRPSETAFGLAAYDTAVARFYEGAYSAAARAFRRLLTLQSAPAGYDRRRCAFWLRHAGACAGYHAERAKLGIP